MQDAGKAVAIHAAHAGAERHVRFVEQDAGGRVERMIPGAGQVVGKLLDARLMRDRRVGIRRACGRLRRVLSAFAVYLVEILGLRVIRLHILITDRPRGRNAVVMREAAEVLLAQAKQRRTVHFRRPADIMIRARLELLPILVAPKTLRYIAAFHEDLLGAPILRLALEPAAPFHDENAFPRGSQMSRQRSSSGSAAYNDDVIIGFHGRFFRLWALK